MLPAGIPGVSGVGPACFAPIQRKNPALPAGQVIQYCEAMSIQHIAIDRISSLPRRASNCSSQITCLKSALLVAFLVLALSSPGADTPPRPDVQQAWLSKANRHEKAGWVYLHIEGAPRTRGFQHGYLLAPEIKQGIKAIRADWEYQSATKWPWLLAKADAMFARKQAHPAVADRPERRLGNAGRQGRGCEDGQTDEVRGALGIGLRPGLRRPEIPVSPPAV